jgi:hypothetical protein
MSLPTFEQAMEQLSNMYISKISHLEEAYGEVLTGMQCKAESKDKQRKIEIILKVTETNTSQDSKENQMSEQETATPVAAPVKAKAKKAVKKTAKKAKKKVAKKAAKKKAKK